MPRNPIIPYKPELRANAKKLRKNSTLGEILLWEQIRKRKLGFQFHRQVPVHNYVIDFYCDELNIAIEVDGNSHNNPDQKEKDYIRDYTLNQLGITVIRIDDLDVKKNLNSVTRFLEYRIDQIRNGKNSDG